ncbi:MAG: DUF1127 domain-containing protein [Pseudodonghicola sp.]|nr:DUF1127 domain-containing protein [Pseudodonghicola sp.]
MAVYDTNRTAPESAILFGRVGAAICTVISAIAVWNDARVTRNALSALSDRELEDIGLNRGEIDLIAQRKVSI